MPSTSSMQLVPTWTPTISERPTTRFAVLLALRNWSRSCPLVSPVSHLGPSSSKKPGCSNNCARPRPSTSNESRIRITEMQVVNAANPVTFRDQHRTSVVMPLEAGGTIAASQDMLPIPSTEEIPLEPVPSPDRRIIPMPAQPPEDPRPQDPRERSNGLIDLFAETEALRTLLSDALSRTSRLLAGLRHHKRQAHAVQVAMASLRKLQIDH